MKQMFLGLLTLASFTTFAMGDVTRYQCKTTKLGNFELIYIADNTMNGYSTTLIDASGKSIALHAYKDSEVGSFDAASKNMNTLLTFSTRTGPGSMLYQDALDNVVCLCK